jgi:long-chain acyl-CoA synthetase
MPSTLDLRVRAATEAITSPTGPMPVGVFNQHGVDLPIITSAPPSLAHYFAATAAMHAQTEFLVDGEERLTFADTYARARVVAGALVEGWGVKTGDRVGIAMRNAPAWVIIYMGILMAGGVATLLNGWWQGGELAEGIEDVEASLVFADTQRAQRLADAGVDGGAKIVTLNLAQPTDAVLAPILAAGGGADTILPELAGDDLANILFTSGSTGRSKGAFCTHRAVVQGTYSYIVQAMMMLHIATEDGLVKEGANPPCMLMTVPLFHVTGEVPMLLVSYALGRKIIFMPKWDVVRAMQLIEKEKVTSFTGVPLMSFELMTSPERHKYDLSSLQGLAGGGAPRPVEHVKRLSEEMPTSPPALGYGLTETNGVGAGNFMSNYQEKPNSTGVASKPLSQIAILDDEGKPVPQGERGEVCIRSVALFSGYWNRPDATRECMTSDGWFRTGDVGYLDPDDYLFIVDRKKDIIIRGGENISCQEVEAAIYENKAVAEACVFGLPDERLGEVVGAAVHCHDGMSLDEAALRDFLAEHLAGFKVPLRIWFHADPLPRLGTEKLDKVGLRKRYQEEWVKQAA